MRCNGSLRSHAFPHDGPCASVPLVHFDRNVPRDWDAHLLLCSTSSLAPLDRRLERAGRLYNRVMRSRTRILTWNGKDVPSELRELPAGRYVVEAVDDEAPALSAEEEAGIEAALESYRQGRFVDAKRAREIIDAALGR
jgi:hypothetical protein